jgi:putative addiction module killer protein
MHIQHDGHFGTINDAEDGVFELKWKDGRRIYYVYLQDEDVLLLLGGNKNGQSYDINQAKKILKEYTQNES